MAGGARHLAANADKVHSRLKGLRREVCFNWRRPSVRMQDSRSDKQTALATRLAPAMKEAVEVLWDRLPVDCREGAIEAIRRRLTERGDAHGGAMFERAVRRNPERPGVVRAWLTVELSAALATLLCARGQS